MPGEISSFKRYSRPIIALLFFTFLAFLMTLPLSVDPGNRALDLGADTRLFLWTLAWDIHALGHQPLSFFDANIFYPEASTLAYSEHLFGSALIGAPWMVWSGNPLLTLNAVALISCIACGLGGFFLARQLGVGVAGALVAGVVFSFAPPRFFRIGQLHMATVQWIPFCLAFLHRYATGGTRRHLVAAALFFTLQAWSGGQSAFFLLLAATGLFLFFWIFGLFRPRGGFFRDAAVAGLLALALNVPFLLPYLEVQRESGLSRALEEAEQWSPNAVSFLAAPTHAQKALLSTVPGLERKVLGRARGYLFPGFLCLVLAALALGRRRRMERAEPVPPPPRGRVILVIDTFIVISAAAVLLIQSAGGIYWKLGGLTLSARSPAKAFVLFLVLTVSRLGLARKTPFSYLDSLRRFRDWVRHHLESRTGIEVGFYLMMVVLSLWAALGPRLGLYAALYRLLPGFDFIRAPSRLTVLTLLGLAILAGVGFERLSGWFRPALRWIPTIACLALLTFEYAAFPLDARPYDRTVPDVDRWLASQPKSSSSVVVGLPVADPRDAAHSARLHSVYMLYSIGNWHHLVNGYSGFTPSAHDALFRKLVNFPDDTSMEALEAWGVDYAVLHAKRYSSSEWSRLQNRLRSYGDRLKLDYEGVDGRVYRLIPPKSRR